MRGSTERISDCCGGYGIGTETTTGVGVGEGSGGVELFVIFPVTVVELYVPSLALVAATTQVPVALAVS